MARADLILNLVQSVVKGDQMLFRRTVEALVAEERARQHHVLADRLAEQLNSNGQIGLGQPPRTHSATCDFVYEVAPSRRLSELFLPEAVEGACHELVEEQNRSSMLHAHNLEPRHRVLLVGPPGNGKTSLAEALAESLMVPLFVVRYETLIGSYLGETSARLRQLFDHVRTRRSVLFFDEFDVVGKERGDEHETGEIKRVVSTLLLQIDALPSYVVVVTASNHPELLDRAVWRRFQVRLELPPPGRQARQAVFERFESRLAIPLGYAPRTLADRLAGLSFAELEDFCTDLHRTYVLSLPDANMKKIVTSRLQQWERRLKRRTVEQG